MSYMTLSSQEQPLFQKRIPFPVSTGICPHSLPEWAFRARYGLWRIFLCPKVARIAEHKFGSSGGNLAPSLGGRENFARTFLIFLVIDQIFRIFTDFPDLYFLRCRA